MGDVRLTIYDGELYTAHGPEAIIACTGIRFDDFLETTFEFLAQHPGEFLVWSLRWEYGTPNWDEVKEKFNEHSKFFYQGSNSQPEDIMYEEMKQKITICKKNDENYCNFSSFCKIICEGSWGETKSTTANELVTNLKRYSKDSDNFQFLEAIVNPVTEDFKNDFLNNFKNIGKALSGKSLLDHGKQANMKLEREFFP